jgi:recombination protein RecA
MAKDKEIELTREEKLNALIKQVNQDYGIGTVVTNETLPEVKKFSSGSFSLDRALGGGWARGRMIEILGNESAGKSSIALHAVAEIQRLGGIAAYVDSEMALDPLYAKALNVNMDALLIAQPFCAEHSLDITDQFASSGLLDLVVVDSVAALVPKAELEGDVGDAYVGLQARIMSQAMRMITGPAARNGTTIMFINQLRDKINMYGTGGKTTSGGNALKYYASQRVELYRPNKPIEKNGEPIGIQVEAKIIKNKVAPPFRTASLFIRWGQGIDTYTDVLRIAVEKGLVSKGGAWYTYGEHKIQGEDSMAEYIKEKGLYEQLVKEVSK